MSVNEAHEPGCREHGLPEGVALVIEGRPRPIGSLDVTRILPEKRLRNVGPFVFLDHMGPVTLAPGHGFDVPPHPHIGLSTVTYLLDGELVHRDSLGSVQSIEPLALNLMAAGRGIVHSERSSPEGRVRGASLHGLQLWLAHPEAAEEAAPSFHHHPEESLPSLRRDGVDVRLLLGSAHGGTSPARDPSDPLLVDLFMPAGSTFTLSPHVAESALYVMTGAVTVEERPFAARELVVRKPGASLSVVAREPTRAMILGGPPLDGRRYMHWNFVSSSRERIERAKEDWRTQRFSKIPGDDREFVPLPE